MKSVPIRTTFAIAALSFAIGALAATGLSKSCTAAPAPAAGPEIHGRSPRPAGATDDTSPAKTRVATRDGKNDPAEPIDDPFAQQPPLTPSPPTSLVPSKNALAQFGEPDWSGAAATTTSVEVRFILVPTFNNPISIRASKTNGKATLTVVQMAGKGGYEWETVKMRKTIEIDDGQWAKLAELCAVGGARKPTDKMDKEFREGFVDFMSGLDGQVWFLEVKDDKGYTVEGVPNPTDSPLAENSEEAKALKNQHHVDLEPFVDVCRYLFELSGFKEGEDY